MTVIKPVAVTMPFEPAMEEVDCSAVVDATAARTQYEVELGAVTMPLEPAIGKVDCSAVVKKAKRSSFQVLEMVDDPWP